MRLTLIVLAAAGALLGGLAQAQVPAKCAGCHDLEKKKVGPAFKDAAAKNKGNKDAAAGIVAKMKNGKGHPKVAGTDDELKTAVEGALATK